MSDLSNIANKRYGLPEGFISTVKGNLEKEFPDRDNESYRPYRSNGTDSVYVVKCGYDYDEGVDIELVIEVTSCDNLVDDVECIRCGKKRAVVTKFTIMITGVYVVSGDGKIIKLSMHSYEYNEVVSEIHRLIADGKDNDLRMLNLNLDAVCIHCE